MTGRTEKHGGGAARRQGGPQGDDLDRRPSRTPYRLITSDDPCKTLAQGEVRYFPTVLRAANAFVKSPAPFKQIIFDDGCTARELNRDEQWMLETVARILGHEVHDVEVGT